MISAVPFVFILPLLQEPGGVLALVLSYIPFLTSSIMCARIFLQTPPWWEIVFSVIWLLLWIVLVTIISAKIFRVGILAYGKKMTLKEIITAIKAG
jgi:ABC-2 type transport system permease protein